MRFSIKDLVKDVEDFQNKKFLYNELLLKSQKKVPFYKFWEDKVSQFQVDEAFRQYISAMQKLEQKYNPHFYKRLLRPQVPPSAPPYSELPSMIV
jgi:hypothetical protein